MRKITLTVLMVFGLMAWNLNAQTVCGNSPENIPAGTATSGSMNPSIAVVPDAGVIGTDYSLENITMNIQHTWADDLDVTLTSPGGTSIDIMMDRGGSDGLDVAADLVFTDASGNLVTGWAGGPPAADYQAEGGMLNTVFDGESITGNWTLNIVDDTGGDSGVLNSYCITFASLAPPPIASCGNAPENIPAGTGTSGSMNPSIAVVPDAGVIGTSYTLDNITMNIQHTWADDLDVTLTSPGGTSIDIMMDRGGSDGLDVAADLVFTDASGNLVTGWAGGPPAADYQAEGGMLNTVFDGESITGNWTLNIVDDTGGDSGVLNSYCINFEPILFIGSPPVINCPMDVAVSTDPGVCGAVVNFADAIAFDVDDDPILPVVTQTMGDPSGSVFPVGDSIIEFTATDLDGNTATCQFTITVTDDEDPVAECMDLTVELDENGVATVAAADFLANSSDNCGVTDILVGTFLQTPGSLTTTFGSNNGFAGNMFEVVPLTDITLQSVDINMASGATDDVEVYYKEGTYSGFENDAGAWTLGGSTNVTSAGDDVPTPLNLSMGIQMMAGTTYSLYVSTAGANINYTNGSAEGALWVSNADLEVYEGIGRGTPIFGGGIFSPRNWNGNLHYDTNTLVSDIELNVDCSDVGTQEVVVSVLDAVGNISTCTANVTVEDNIAPEIVCIGEFAAFSETVSDDPGVAIPDNDPTGASATINIADDVEITDLDIHLDIEHTWVGDLQVIIESPAGTQVMVVDRPGYIDTGFGCSENDLQITLDDEATDPIEDECSGSPITGTFTPNNPLSAFDGESTMGDWIITVIDNAGGDTGTIQEWGMTYSYETTGVPLEVDLDANGMATIDASALLLNVDEACGWTATVGSEGSAASLETTFGGGNQFHGNMFDVNVINGVTFDSFDVHLEDGISDDVEVYWKMGTFVGFETDAGAWTLLGTASVSSAGLGVPTPLDMDLGLAVAAGETVAFYVTTTQGGLMQYTNGVGLGSVFASDANIEFLEGNGGEYPFNVTFSPRVFNGNIHYTEADSTSTTIDFDCSHLGENQIEVTVTDASGNTATCIATVNVNDVTSPILVCQDITIELDETGHAEVDPADLLATLPGTYEVITISSDNGSNAEGFTDLEVDITEATDITFDWDYSTNDGPQWDSFGYLLNGVFTELTDPAGDLNQSGSAGPISVAPGDVFGFRSYSFDGTFGAATTVVSNFMPGFEGQFEPDNWVLTLDNSDGDAYFVEIPGGPLSFDACGITVLAVDVTDVYCEDIGDPIPVMVFASDASGNIAACNATITVVDAMGPEMTCPEDMTVDPGEDNLFYEVPDYWADGLATATDNCTDPVTITTQDPAPGDLIPDGVYTVTLTAEDEYGNVSVCTFELTVESVLGISDSALEQAVGIYPNPATNQFTIHNSSSVALSVANIYDVNGKLVNTVDLSQMAAEQTIDVSLLASGMYMVHIIGDEASAIKRLIKE